MKTFIKNILLILTLFIAGCNDYLDVEPVGNVVRENAIIDETSARSALAGLYSGFSGLTQAGFTGLLGDLANMSDEQNHINPSNRFTLNSLDSELFNASPWNLSWSIIRDANNIIELLPPVSTVSDEEKEQILAETKCIRAFNYMQMIQFWGDIPFSESTDFRVLDKLPRTDKLTIYSSIIQDVMEAEAILPVEYETNGKTRTRFTKGAANALLARMALYTENWDLAINTATKVIDNTLYSLQVDYEQAFTKNSVESILELFSSGNPPYNLAPSLRFFPNSLGGLYSFVPTQKIYDSFENGDLRRDIAIGKDVDGLIYINKYKDIFSSGNFQELKIFRLAELYLIRAEARAQKGDIPGALDDINVIRNRAGLANTTAIDKSAVLLVIEQERFVELSFEGHRFIDLVRTDRADEILGAFSLGWDPIRSKLLPIPAGDILINPNLTQNPGY